MTGPGHYRTRTGPLGLVENSTNGGAQARPTGPTQTEHAAGTRRLKTGTQTRHRPSSMREQAKGAMLGRPCLKGQPFQPVLGKTRRTE